MTMSRNHLFLMIVLLTAHISAGYAQAAQPLITLEQFDPQFGSIVGKTAKAEILADGFLWSEGPVWVDSRKMLIFSDVKKNIIYKWTKDKGKEVYLKPSGYTGTVPRGGELGSNGLGLNIKGQLVICQDGDRVVSVMDAL